MPCCGARPAGCCSGASSVGWVATPPRTSRIMLGEKVWNQPPPKLRFYRVGLPVALVSERQQAVDVPLGPAEEDVVLGGEVVVDPHLERIRVVRLLAEVHVVEVVDDLAPGEVGPHHVGAQERLHRGRDQVLGNDVAGERIPHRAAVHDARGVRVVNGPRERGEVPVQPGVRRRDDVAEVGVLAIAPAVVRGEEEGLVLDDGPSDVDPELALLELGGCLATPPTTSR